MIDSLFSETVETHSLKKYPSAIQLDERANVFSTTTSKDGLFEVQEQRFLTTKC